MAQVETKPQVKKRYTLGEVQRLAFSTYNLLVQPLNTRTYGIFFEGQLIAQAKRLVDVVAAMPDLYRAIQEQLAEQAKAIAPVMGEAIALAAENVISEELQPQAYTTFSHHAYDDATSWEMREQLNRQGYEDAIAHRLPVHNKASTYMAGYNRGARDRTPLTKS
ncbi:MAG: hypothetical protein RMZ41_003060 [Nostoc sp. DedVER02]|uniref:hypothetical protein n=1 Tax=unclassified Nostoc TaxID=2593658 RepID=UPI002AD58518|nr:MULTISPECIES: hypothetical protein [unclassified Nostoc]MDZ7986865.1 hypothetical protein [Nostoc sp. DedVER02]MDZ8115767.1 hypothetical protein [Nostoc sp. DedVER01b]